MIQLEADQVPESLQESCLFFVSVWNSHKQLQNISQYFCKKPLGIFAGQVSVFLQKIP